MLATDFASWNFHHIYVNYDIFLERIGESLSAPKQRHQYNTIQYNQSILFIEFSTKPLATEAFGEHSPHTDIHPSFRMLRPRIVRLVID